MISQKEVQHKFFPILEREGKEYAKFKQVIARVAAGGEEIVSETSDGVETVNTAEAGDFIVQNQTEAREEYVVPSEKFRERYDLIEKWDDGRARYQPKGHVYAVKLTPELLSEIGLQSEFEIEAPWGEAQKVVENDYMVTPPDKSEIYRIAFLEFGETYRLLQ